MDFANMKGKLLVDIGPIKQPMVEEQTQVVVHANICPMWGKR
jgi:hypothetical protein